MVMSRSDRIALALHQELAHRLDDEPVFIVNRALRNVPRARAQARGDARAAVERWEVLLRSFDLGGLRGAFVGQDECSRQMRNVSVFQGILPMDERDRIVEDVLRAA